MRFFLKLNLIDMLDNEKKVHWEIYILFVAGAHVKLEIINKIFRNRSKTQENPKLQARKAKRKFNK